jgi:predicted RNase H-like HicB family nuclease
VRYLIVIDKAGNNCSGYSPDLPGCIATGQTREETERNLREAIGLHLGGMQEDGQSPAVPTTTAECLDG